MTIFTTMSAFRNIDHGDRSLGNEPIVCAAGAVGPLGGVDGDAGLLSTALGTPEELGAVWTAGGASDLGGSCASAHDPTPIDESRTRHARVDRSRGITAPRPGLGWTSRYISSLIPLAQVLEGL
jgi:hypothetical protein